MQRSIRTLAEQNKTINERLILCLDALDDCLNSKQNAEIDVENTALHLLSTNLARRLGDAQAENAVLQECVAASTSDCIQRPTACKIVAI